MQGVRLHFVAVLIAAVVALATAANAQPFGGPPPPGFGPPPRHGPPLMRAPSWITVERAGQTWDGIWTFDRGHRSMSGSWVNRQTGQRVYARRMFVRQEGRQIVIARPGLGNYVGTLSGDGRSISGTMSWVAGRFTARM